MKKLLCLNLVAMGLFAVRIQAQVEIAPQPTAAIQSYFNPVSRGNEIKLIQNKILEGCRVALKEQPAIKDGLIKNYVDQSKAILQAKFSKSFNENPLIKSSMDRALDAISLDSSCSQPGNDCRTRLMATAMYYYQNLRPNVPGCEKYIKNDDNLKNFKQKCEIEIQYRSKILKSYGRANGGINQQGAYTDVLIDELNKTTDELSSLILHKNSTQVHICEDVQSGVAFQMLLRTNLYSDPFVGLDPSLAPESNVKPTEKPEPEVEKKPEPCVEDIKVLHSEFVPMNFPEGSATVGSGDVKPVTERIENFVASHSGMVITNIEVTASSSRTPFYKIVNSKKIVDPESDSKNLALANRRAEFAKTAFASIIKNHPELAKASYSASGAINGPEFEVTDISDRAVTSKNSSYNSDVDALYAKYKDMLAEAAMIKSSSQLLDTKRFPNLYDVKYKPYQGFKIVIKGYSYQTRKCSDAVVDETTKLNSTKKLNTKPNNSTTGNTQN